MPLADTTALLDLVQNLNVADADPALVYMASKSMSALVPSGTPRGFVEAVRNRLQSSSTKDDLAGFAYLAKTMGETDGYNVINGAWFAYGQGIKTLSGLGKTRFPAHVESDLVPATGVNVFTASAASWSPDGGVPAWWNDNTLVRVRIWGGGGGGSPGYNFGGAGGSGGGYTEVICPYKTILGQPVTIGAAGARYYTTGVGNGGGASGIGPYGAGGGGGGGTYTDNSQWQTGGTWTTGYTIQGGYSRRTGNASIQGPYPGTPGQSLPYDATNAITKWSVWNKVGGNGGAGGTNYYTQNGSMYYGYGYGGTGGGSAAGPWGDGFDGGTSSAQQPYTNNSSIDFYAGTGGGGTFERGFPQSTTVGPGNAHIVGAFPGSKGAVYLSKWASAYLLSNLGGSAGAAATSSVQATAGGPGAGGGGGYSESNASSTASVRKGANGGIFGGGGGTGSTGGTATAALAAGNGGIGAGGGGWGYTQYTEGSGLGGPGLVIVEYFI